jgi:hypothetical protein
MKRYFVGLLLMLPTLFSFAQEERNIVVDENAQVRKLSGFSGIEVSGAIDLYISQGKEDAVAVSAGNKEQINYIKTEVKNDVLHIYFESKGLNWRKWTQGKIKAYVTVSDLKRLEASGACNVKTTNTIHSDALEMELSGASDLSGSINVRSLVLKLSGASVLSLNGKAVNAYINCSGASAVKSYDLVTDYSKIVASGASSVRVHVAKALNVNASGASSVSYKGNDIQKEINSTGASSVKHKITD